MAAKGSKGNRDRFSTTTRLRLLGEQTAARVYRSQTRRQARRSRLTGRAALLVLVLCTLVVALAYPIRSYFSQATDIADQEQARNEAEQRVEQLRDAKARLQDDAYIVRLSREHLHYVLPGETGFTMHDPDASGSAERPGEGERADRPWYSHVWGGVDEADRQDP